MLRSSVLHLLSFASSASYLVKVFIFDLHSRIPWPVFTTSYLGLHFIQTGALIVEGVLLFREYFHVSIVTRLTIGISTLVPLLLGVQECYDLIPIFEEIRRGELEEQHEYLKWGLMILAHYSPALLPYFVAIIRSWRVTSQADTIALNDSWVLLGVIGSLLMCLLLMTIASTDERATTGVSKYAFFLAIGIPMITPVGMGLYLAVFPKHQVLLHGFQMVLVAVLNAYAAIR